MIGRASAKDGLSEKKVSIPTPKPPKDSIPPSNNPPHNPNSPTNPNQLQFTVKYHVLLGPNHMYCTDSGLVQVILIDKENPIFLNKELTKKGQNYTVTFLAKDAEKYENQSHVYYFSKNNNKFSLKSQKQPDNPEPGDKKEEKFVYVGMSVDRTGESRDAVFTNLLLDEDETPSLMKSIHVRKNHPRIKQLSSEGKLQQDKKFIVRYGKVDQKSEKGIFLTFNEDNSELEIIEV